MTFPGEAALLRRTPARRARDHARRRAGLLGFVGADEGADMARRVVVGWDGSAAATAALEWSVRHCPTAESVEIVEVKGIRRRDDRPAGDADEAAETVRQAQPSLTVTVAREQGNVAEVLAERSAPDALVALGGRGHEEARYRRRTSTAYRVVLAADGPVVVVPEAYRGGRGVVVGIAGPAEAACVVLSAAAEAARRRQPLIAVHVAQPVFGVGLDALAGAHRAQPDSKEERELMDEALAPVTELYPDLRVVRRLTTERASDALLAAARASMLLVLGRSDGRPSNHRPITQSSMLLSRSPVMVVPPETMTA